MDESRWARLSEMLDALFDLDAPQREASLDALAAEDPGLAAELRQLLAADQRSGVLDQGVLAGSPTLASGLESAARKRAEGGARLGHYRLVERIGSGGMGEVWRAQRDDDFEQQVAIKLIRPLVDSEALRERFARERRILARLDHPNIARLLDGGVSEDGAPWYAMELVRGQPLQAHVEAAQLDARGRVQLLLQVCDAVAHAHAQLVVHRDLKPSNILVDAEGRVRVLDFGIARLIDDSADLRLTSTGVRVFSPAYAAPEQIRGEPVGTSADVFALGAVLYELLTGEPPFPQRSATPERLIAQLDDEVTPRPGATLRRQSREGSFRGHLQRSDEELDTIVATALQPDPLRRYQGALQLAEDLRRWLDGRPIAARADSAAYRFRKFVVRHRLAVGSASGVLLALIGGLALALWQADVARRHAERADAEAARAEREASLARDQVLRTRKVKEFFVQSFVQADPLKRSDAGPQTFAEALDAAITRAGSELDGDPVLQADVLDDFGEIRAGQGRFDEAQALFERALELAEKAHGPNHPAVAESLLNLGALHGYRGDILPGAPHIERAMAILQADHGGQPTVLANAHNVLAAVRSVQGDMDSVAQSIQAAVEIYREHAPDDPQFLMSLSNLAHVHQQQGRRDEAEAGYRETLARVEATMGNRSPHMWPNLYALASIAYDRGKHDEELALLRQALDVARHNYPGDHPWVANSLNELGWVLAREGDLKAGEPLMQEGIAMNRRLGRAQAIGAMRRLAVAYQHHKREAEARATFDEVWSMCERNNMQAQQECVVIRANRAQLLAYAGQGELALNESEAAMASLGNRAEGLVSEWGQVEQARAAALSALGRRDEALALQDAVIARYSEAFGPEHRETASARSARPKL
ncbi:serine/threonine-protein kinase [Pseudomarimonas salicorniae]|uniref:Tetratricopeptide repeat protein n=1 Tax=Pseudomarimonas salicorniae TaxID=2933270 RepID=A0ABT0GEV6_9GAMM|nr:serine/threonine-protein kinase [Lysobacter sp. CAU 1642]MCK7593071.1 tetratricopeptide repeat protein [Lysobacter sp. CAU 1642]